MSGMRMSGAATLLPIAVCLLALSAGCEREPPPTPPVSEDLDPSLAAFEKKRVEREQQLSAMPVVELAQAVASDSAQHVEPFNSAAVREIRKRAKDRKPEERDALAKELAATLKEADARSHLGLVAVREVSPTVYRAVDADFRYRVLTDALARSEYFNAWGVPHLFLDQPAGRTIICENRGIERYLYPLLDLDQPTPVFGGGEIVEEHEAYGYRVKDYAWALLNQLRGTPVEIPMSPKERDVLIEQTKRVPPASDKIPVGQPTIDCGEANDTPDQTQAPAQAN
jgi:hypothetical protein